MICHTAESLYTREPLESTLNLPLPWPEEDFVAGCPRHEMVSMASGRSNNGLYCELIKAMTFWYKLSAHSPQLD